ncbi:MAG: c-type cytochrome, partial [Acidobacteria bacterium]|nr:c-type cytochrome [Acidobacteriota bacterium]
MSDTPLTHNPDDPHDLVEPTEPIEDPITSKSLHVPILVSALVLVATLLWALYEEALGHRPWREYQDEFVALYGGYLKKAQPIQTRDETEIRKSAEYRRLDEAVKAAEATATPKLEAINKELAAINRQLDALSEPFQLARSQVAALIYQTETTENENSQRELEEDLERLKRGPFVANMPSADGSRTERTEYTFEQVEATFNDLKRRQGLLQTQRGEVLKPVSEARSQREAYVANQIEGLTPEQLVGLQRKMESFTSEIKQINVPDVGLVERCESCHLGIREPLALTRADMGGKGVFVTHPNRRLLEMHDPERFGCTPCHGGNGIATTSVATAHGQYKHWLWPKYERENVEAGCQQCHQSDIVLEHAAVLDQGKQTFLNRGCWGCHARENFDPEPAQIQTLQKTIEQLQEQKEANLREAGQVERQADRAADNATAQRLYQQAENLRVGNSTLDAQLEQFNLRLKSLITQQKKAGPNLKEIQNKLRKEWIPVWIQNPHNFRPTTKMPRFRLDRDEVEAISAFLWQSAIQNQPPIAQPAGDPTRGKEAFESRGCLACHSIGEGEQSIGGAFAANLSRVGEKVNYDYLVRWIHNPRERTLPYCP